MDETIKKKLVWVPASLAIAGFIVALLIIYFVPYQLSKAVSLISKTEQTVQFPSYMAYLVILGFTFHPLFKLATNLILISRWQKGSLPSCPVCRHPMIKRIAKRGSYAGQTFWGCVQFPKCGGTIHVG
ncbi:hypothetical protein [Aurantivibrio infirmus]